MKLPEQRVVAGLSCEDVLERLSDYVDGSLSAEAHAQVEGHLAGCDVCERFGGQFVDILAEFRRALSDETPANEVP